ncbi:hypothetical protein [Streptomyces sp. SID8352]|uniref:hypothetical protein n=1 Tax=Streptomyces sp. SID8352 TaxID=2690338 RepID=UPI0013713071|nr:hypothetical protein [Streptomyces sp. SID8352]MYU26295.1 hypothetical protein [Streptomyces sp. SID8352]
MITGTAHLHVGELADARAAAGGAPTLFAAELTVHPGVDSIARDGLRSAEGPPGAIGVPWAIGARGRRCPGLRGGGRGCSARGL